MIWRTVIGTEGLSAGMGTMPVMAALIISCSMENCIVHRVVRSFAFNSLLDHLARHADHEDMIRHILGDDRSRADDAVRADLDAIHHRGTDTNVGLRPQVAVACNVHTGLDG